MHKNEKYLTPAGIATFCLIMLISIALAILALTCLGLLGSIALYSTYAADNIDFSIPSIPDKTVAGQFFLHTPPFPELRLGMADPSLEFITTTPGFFTFYRGSGTPSFDQVVKATPDLGEYTEDLLISHRDKPYNEPSEEIIEGLATWYCACDVCNEGWAGTTANGESLEALAVEYNICGCNWLPLKSKILIRFGSDDSAWIPYLVADRGSWQFDTIGRIDIYEPRGHDQVMANGRQSVEVVVVECHDY
ncbi:MAG: 3D domain-containing protein [Clostridiales bacterium]|nr:3D domain-containing protein [Clostridiales bacterium]